VDTSDTRQRIWTLIEPIVQTEGFELVDIDCGLHGNKGLVRLFLDKQEGGVTLDDCASVSEVIGPVLDNSDVFPSSYVLEVSSPGFDRPVRKRSDFERFEGERVKMKTYTPVQGRSKFTGTLAGMNEDLVAVDCDGEVVEIHLENLRKANLDR